MSVSTQGGLFDVHVSVSVPGNLITVRRSHSGDPKHADPYVALRDAFTAAKRQVQDCERISRGEVKSRAQESREAPSA